ncbi:MAG: hypothetical protein OXF73_11775 [Gammaproteobacteria bacterium]|nr:hypothetical protein [Gammaproteobacteria bacterium]MCY4227192.1 hypothetical protein [Gammaproteobacteria bacterium]
MIEFEVLIVKPGNCKLKSFIVLTASLLILCTQAWAQNISAETNNDNSPVVIETPIVVYGVAVPELIVKAIDDAIVQYSNDPEALQQAIREIIREHASDQASIDFATAITAIAASRVTGDSQLLTAIALGATQGNPGISSAAMIESIPELRSEPTPEERIEQNIALSQATVENPAQVSPTSL